MTELRPWAGFDSLVDGLVRLQSRAREEAVRSVDEILTLRNWLIGAWIVAYEQEGADRARYGEGLIDALAMAFKARGVRGLGRSNLRNYRQIALTWPRLLSDIRQTLSGESASGHTWQTLPTEAVPQPDQPLLHMMFVFLSRRGVPSTPISNRSSSPARRRGSSR